MADRPSTQARPPAGSEDDHRRPKTPEKTVPPPEQQRSTKETPAKPRSAHSSKYWDGTLGEKRMSLLEDLGYAIPEVGADTFLNIFFPPLKKGIDVDSIKRSLESEGVITKSNGRWAAFPDGPKKSHSSENAAFSPLEGIFDKVVEHATRSTSALTQTFALRLLPNTAPESERGSLTRPDGCVILKEVEDSNNDPNNMTYRWYDIGLTCEFKLQDGVAQQDDNVTKIVYSMQHSMTLDPCKRFTFGITIEDTRVRLWFSSRAIMAVSEPFNFNEKPDLLIRVFLSLAFATKVELGWDPTIRLVDPKAKKRVYEIQVNQEWYRVVDVLSDFGADAIIGRATRVFRVTKLRTGDLYVLKDVWVEDDRELEHDIYKRILDDVKNKFDEGAMKQVASHLLTPVDHCLMTVDGQRDHTMDVMMRGQAVSFASFFRLKAQEFGNKDTSKSVGPMKSTDRDVHDELNVHLGSRITPEGQRNAVRHRRHYRVVFQEVARPIWTVTNLSHVFLVLMHCAFALKLIHDSGWIHRDISAGNIYLFDERGLIGDLEYARKVTVDGSHQMRTGTPDFMAVEVMTNSYTFLPKGLDAGASLQYSKLLVSSAEQKQDLKPLMQQFDKQIVEEPPFVQNEAHDIESLWWISMYILFFNGVVNSSEEEDSTRRHSRTVWAQRIFSGGAKAPVNRLNFLSSDTNFKEGTAWFPGVFGKIVKGLKYLKESIVTCYKDYEGTFLPDIKKESITTLQLSAVNYFQLCMILAKGMEISSYKVLGRQRQENLSQPGASTTPSGPAAAEESPPRDKEEQKDPKGQRILTDAPEGPRRSLRIQLARRRA